MTELVLLEDALQEHEEHVDALLKSGNSYVTALKAWKKACQVGHLGDLAAKSALADERSRDLPQKTATAKSTWEFDARVYLESGAWRDEVREIAASKFALRTLDDGDSLIASPVTVTALPLRGELQIGKTKWSAIRPRVVAAELKRLRDKTANANSKDFLESLLGACRYLGTKETPAARFRDIYKLFCLSPGYRRDNPEAAFGQQIYALQRAADVRVTRAGYSFGIETISGKAGTSDAFSVTTEDGRLVRYHNIWFKGPTQTP